jgi:hypothetical protein
LGILGKFGKLVLLSVMGKNMICPLSTTEELFVTIMARIGINLQVLVLDVVEQKLVGL